MVAYYHLQYTPHAAWYYILAPHYPTIYTPHIYPTHMKHNKLNRYSKGANKHIISIHLHDEGAWAQLWFEWV